MCFLGTAMDIVRWATGDQRLLRFADTDEIFLDAVEIVCFLGLLTSVVLVLLLA